MFVIEASPDDVGAYYQKELEELGFMLMSYGVNDEDESQMMVFMGSSGALYIFHSSRWIALCGFGVDLSWAEKRRSKIST